MKRIVWLGAAALIAIAAAIPLWLVLDGGDERRAAALTENINEGAARLTLEGVNDGKPFNLQGYSWGAERQAEGVKLHDLEFTRDISEISPQLFDIAAPSATLELLAPSQSGETVVTLVYQFTDVALRSYEDGGEFIQGSAAVNVIRRARTTARMTFAEVSQQLSSAPIQDAGIGRMTVSGTEGKGVPIRAYKFAGAKSGGGALLAKSLVITRAIDRLAPWFAEAVVGGTPRSTKVTIDLIAPNTGTGTPETYASYVLTDVTVESVRDFDTRYDNDTLPPVQEVELSFASVQLTSAGKTATLTPSH